MNFSGFLLLLLLVYFCIVSLTLSFQFCFSHSISVRMQYIDVVQLVALYFCCCYCCCVLLLYLRLLLCVCVRQCLFASNVSCDLYIPLSHRILCTLTSVPYKMQRNSHDFLLEYIVRNCCRMVVGSIEALRHTIHQLKPLTWYKCVCVCALLCIAVHHKKRIFHRP